jgi:hypothetical protein
MESAGFTSDPFLSESVTFSETHLEKLSAAFGTLDDETSPLSTPSQPLDVPWSMAESANESFSKTDTSEHATGATRIAIMTEAHSQAP